MIVALLALIAAAAVIYAVSQARARGLAEDELDELRPQLSDAQARLDERGTQIERLESDLAEVRRERDDARSLTDDEVKRAAEVPKALKDLTTATEQSVEEVKRTRTEALDKAFGWAETIANPHAKGSFGEWAVENQLASMGLEEGRDFRRQQAAGSGRVDFSVHFGAAWALIDSKFAAERGLAEIPEAMRSGDRAKLKEWGSRLLAHANRLSAKEYWRKLDQAPAHAPEFTLMYVPVEGAGPALAEALRGKQMSPETFYRERRILLVTPTSLPGILLLLADLVHLHLRSDDAEVFRRKMARGVRAVVDLLELLAKHGGHMKTANNSYDALVAAANGRIADDLFGPLLDFTGAGVQPAELKSIEPPREDAPKVVERLAAKADELDGKLDQGEGPPGGAEANGAGAPSRERPAA